MLMINRVELIFFDQPFEMWKFKCDNPVRRQQTGHPGGEVVEIGHLRQYVIADDEIGHAAFRYETPGETQPEKIDQCWNILAPSGFGHVSGRLDSQHGDAQRQEVLKQISVVARNLNYIALRSKVEPRRNFFAISTRVLNPRGGI